MSGTYAAVLAFPVQTRETRHEEISVDVVEPTLDDTICYLRWRYPEMIESLDDRMKRQREMVLEVLLKKGMTPRELLKLTPSEADELEDLELRLCYHILRDIAYIDSLR
jgi:hypothetical protein